MWTVLTIALSLTVLVSPKWFWSDQIDLDLTMMTISFHFGRDHFILVVTKSLWSSPNQFGQTKTVLVTLKDKALICKFEQCWHIQLFLVLRGVVDMCHLLSKSVIFLTNNKHTSSRSSSLSESTAGAASSICAASNFACVAFHFLTGSEISDKKIINLK